MEKVPGEHAVQEFDPDNEYEPTAQDVQADGANTVDNEYIPEEQEIQLDDAKAAEYVPETHEEQRVPPLVA